MLKEIRAGVDQHAATCVDLMEKELTPENRTSAKIFNFRAIFANPKTSWYGYYMDPTMPNFSQKKWQTILNNFYEKYAGLGLWHDKIVQQVYKAGELRGPTGRIWSFDKKLIKGAWDYNVSQIYNTPVQGTAGDIMKVCLLELASAFKAYPEIHMIMIVHDSFIFDIPDHHFKFVADTCLDVFNAVPVLMQKYFGMHVNCPITGEVKYGPSWGEMQTYERQ